MNAAINGTTAHCLSGCVECAPAQLPVVPKTPDSRFYVSAMRGKGWVALVGPFLTHANALVAVEKANRIACELDANAHWYAYGTCQTPDGARVGKLNAYFADELAADATEAQAVSAPVSANAVDQPTTEPTTEQVYRALEQAIKQACDEDTQNDISDAYRRIMREQGFVDGNEEEYEEE